MREPGWELRRAGTGSCQIIVPRVAGSPGLPLCQFSVTHPSTSKGGKSDHLSPVKWEKYLQGKPVTRAELGLVESKGYLGFGRRVSFGKIQ